MSRVSLKLTAEQRAALRAATGLDTEALELGVEELEERIVPSRLVRGGLPDELGDSSGADLSTLQSAGAELEELEERTEGLRSAFDESEGTDLRNIG